jgi:hypothetical protein
MSRWLTVAHAQKAGRSGCRLIEYEGKEPVKGEFAPAEHAMNETIITISAQVNKPFLFLTICRDQTEKVIATAST